MTTAPELKPEDYKQALACFDSWIESGNGKRDLICEGIIRDLLIRAAHRQADVNNANAANAEQAILNKQVSRWRKEIADLQDKVDFATSGSNAANTGEVMSARDFSAELFLNRQNAQGGYPSRLEYDMIAEYITALLAPHLAKIKRLEEALMFYADEINYARTQLNHPVSVVYQDMGRRAREALSDTAGSEGEGDLNG